MLARLSAIMRASVRTPCLGLQLHHTAGRATVPLLPAALAIG